MDKILEIKNITKKYNTITACDNIIFDVYKGEFLAIIGESGSGKSTLIKIIASLEKTTSGNILYKNFDLTKLTASEFKETRKDIQLVFQDTSGALNPKMKIKDIISEPLLNFKMISKKDINNTAIEYLSKVGLDETFLNKKSSEMSGGQRQRVNIARALTLNPKILLLDEPTSALDVITQSKILELLKTLQKEHELTIIFICHDIALVSNMSDRMIVMKNANLIETLDTNQISQNNLNEYTKELVQATFDLKKCSCKFGEECIH